MVEVKADSHARDRFFRSDRPFGAATARQGLDRRRQLTMMSIDLVGSTPLAERLDPELLRDLIVSYHDLCDRAIARYDGRVGNRAGDGILAHFGVSNPHETDARRAVLTGLSILDGLEPLAERLKKIADVDIEVRIGIHTGQVVITNINDRDELVGPAANETARIQSAATPGLIAVSEQTQQLVADDFTFENSRAVALKGVGKPLGIHDVVGLADTRQRPMSIGPLINRRAEQEQLLSMWGFAQDRVTSKAAMIKGPAGVGKSRLAETLALRAERCGATLVMIRSRDHDMNVPFHPFIALLHDVLQLPHSKTHDEQFDHAASQLEHLQQSTITGLAHVLALSTDKMGDFAGADPAGLHAASRRALIEWTRSLVATGPIVMVAEDLHWADPSTIEVLSELIATPTPGLLILCTARPEFAHAWSVDHVEPIDLEPLLDDEIAEIAEFLIDVELTDEQRAQLIEHSDGIPLFVERLADTVRRDGEIWSGTIPNGLDQLLTTIIEAPHIDRILVGLLATIGRSFDAPFVAEVLGEPVDEVAVRLELLSSQGVLEHDWHGSDQTYAFHHALVQTAAYEHQLASDLRRGHELIARAIERIGVTDLFDDSALARHFDLAGQEERAGAHYVTASGAAHRSGANVEARRLAERGLEIVADITAGTERDRLEAELQLQFALCLTTTEGYGSPRATTAVERAQELSIGLEDTATLLRVTMELYSFATIRGERKRADALIVDGRRHATDPRTRAMLDQCDALQQLCYGELQRSHDMFASVVEYFEIESDSPSDQSHDMPTDGLASSYAHLGHLNWLMGDATASDSWFERAIQRARSLRGSKRAFNEAYATTWMVLVAIQGGDLELGKQRADELAGLCQAKGLTMWGGYASIYQTVALARLDPSTEAAALLEMMTEMLSAMHVESYRPYFITEAGRLKHALGDPEQAVSLFSQAIAVAEQNHEFPEVTESYRLRGRTRLALGEPNAQALDDLLTAAATASDQGATVYGVRALSDIIELFEPQDYPAVVVNDLRELLEQVATPRAYSDVARAEQLLSGLVT